MNLRRVQAAIAESGLHGWLLYDFHGTNPIARRILGFHELTDAPKTTRRWFYWIPASGEPTKLVHRLEPHVLDHLPGRIFIYLTWQELEQRLAGTIAGGGGGGAAGARVKVAMEFSPRARLPYVSRVDGGTIELVRAVGAEVLSSADLAQRFEAALDADARRDHRRTGALLHGIMAAAFERARSGAEGPRPRTEMDLQRWILGRFDEAGLQTSDPPTVAVNEHSADAHFSNTPALDRPIRPGDFLLLDAWAKGRRPGAVYADYTQVAFLGASAPEAHRTAFAAAREARDRAIAFVRESLRGGRAPRGCDVDDAAREVIRARGWADRFFHRTGHSIGEEVHGNGVHLDNLETRDERALLDGTLVSVEPGVYFESFGVRTEVNLLVDGGEAVVTTEPIQTEIYLLEP
jgi:Xaa-Pro aminopeptidase